MKKIICYGDSNTFGFNPSDGSRYNSSIRWTGVLAKILGAEFKIIEEGFNNRTGFFDNPDGYLQSGQKYLSECLEKFKSFEIFVLALGTNDLQKFFTIDTNIVEEGLKNLIEKVRKVNINARIIIIPPVVLDVNVLKGNFCHQFDKESINASIWTQEIYKIVAQKENCELLNLNEHVNPSVVDGLHFDVESHKVIAEIMANHITRKNCIKVK